MTLAKIRFLWHVYKKRMVKSTFSISGLLQNIRSIQEYPPIKIWVNLSINLVSPVLEVKDSNSLPVFEFASSAHHSLNLALKSPLTIE